MSAARQLAFIWSRVLQLLARASPVLSVAIAIVTILEAVAGIGVLYMIKLLVDGVSRELGSDTPGATGRVMELLVLTGAVAVATALLQSAGSAMRMRQGLAVSEYVNREIHDRAISVDLSFYESPRYYDSLERARHGGAERPAQVVSNVILMMKAAIILLGILFLLSRIDLLLIPILLLPVLIALFVRLYYTRRLFDWRMSKAQMERKAGYLDWMMTSASHAKELRLNRIGPHFRDQYRDLRARIRKGHPKIEQARLWTEFAVAILGAGVFIAASAWLLMQSLEAGRPIGDVVLFVLLLRRAEGAGNEFVGNVSRIVDDHLYLRRLFDFLTVQAEIKAPDQPVPVPEIIREGIALTNVSFTYPDAPAPALTNVSLRLPPDRIVALVGENGSGKTTLIKLLTRLHDPTQGRVTLDGHDIRCFDPEDYCRCLSVIFQDYATYAETAGDNIRFGDVSRPASAELTEAAAHKAGANAFIERLPRTYETPLTKLFDEGHDLSIGQWQRLALARAFYPASKFIILDEPTSAVDPKAEFELFENFRQRLAGRGALIISHRLSTIRQADYTYILEAGRIVEEGTHDELVAARGKYADLFEKQAQHYR